MPTRPSNEDFINWAMNEENKSKVQNALKAYPNLANAKESVSFNQICFHLISNDTKNHCCANSQNSNCL